MLTHLSDVSSGAPVALAPYSMEAPGAAGVLILSSARDVILTVPAGAIASLWRHRLWSVQIDDGPPLVAMVRDLICRGERFEVTLRLRHDLCLRAVA